MPIDVESITIDDVSDDYQEPEDQDEPEDKSDDVVDENDEEVVEDHSEPDPELADNEDDLPEDEEETTEDQDEEEEEVETSIFDDLNSRLGYEVDGEFDDSIDGLTDYIDQVGNKKAEQELEQVFGAAPDIEQYVTYRLQGGDPEQYFDTFHNSRNWDEIEVQEENPDQHKEIVRRDLSEDDALTSEDVEETIQDLEDAGLLEKQAKRALKSLKNRQEKRQSQLLEQQKEEHQARQEAIQEHWNNVEETIKEKNEFAGITLPKAEEDDFLKYISEPVNEQGMSQRDIDSQNMSIEESLAIDLILFRGLDALEDIIDKKASTKKAKSIKDRLKSQKNLKDKTPEKKRKSGGSDEVDVEDIDLGAMFSN